MFASRSTSYFVPLLVLVGVVALPGCGGSSSSAIEAVLLQDSLTTTGAESIGDVVSRMRAIDLSECPSDFRQAYINHIHAWEQTARLEEEAKAIHQHYNSGGALVESFFRGFMGDPFGKSKEALADQRALQSRAQQCEHDIQTSFQDVELIAAKYDAALPTRVETSE